MELVIQLKVMLLLVLVSLAVFLGNNAKKNEAAQKKAIAEETCAKRKAKTKQI